MFSRDNYTTNENKYSVGDIEILSPALNYHALVDHSLIKDSNSNSLRSVAKPLPLQGLYYFTRLLDLKD